MKRALLALILALPLVVSAQFRIVGTGLFTTINDSTYRAKIDFRPDLTGFSYNPTQMNDSMYVLSQRGQLYRLDSFYNATFSSAFIVVVEKNGNWGSPVGQVMVFQNNSSLAAPQAVYGANGATAGMQAGVDTWNALLLKVVADSAVYWNEAYSKSIDSISVSGDSLKTISLYQTNGDTLTASFVDGGGGSITMPLDSVAFNTSYVSGFPTGTMAYDADNETVSVGIDGGVIYQLGQELFYPVVINKSDSLIKNGQLVMVDTATLVQGDHVRVVQARNGANYPSNYIMGVATTDIPDDSTGLVTFFGYVREVKHADIAQSGNTLVPGNILYPSPTEPGRYTNVPPSTPAHKSTIALVVRKPSPNNMTLLVRPWLAPKLEDASDVDTAGITQNSVLRYDTASGYWKASTTAGIVAGDTSVFARDFQLGGTTNYLQKSTGTGTIGNSKLYENPSGSFAGYVGWNTTTVNNKFQIGSVGSTGYAGNDFVIGNGSQVMAIEQTSTDTRISTNTNFSFMPAGVGATGNVGIGTASPAHRLDVNGDVNTTGMYKKSGTDIISGTTNRLAMFTGSNTVGNSIVTQNGRNLYINSTQDNSGYTISNLFQFNGFGSSPTDQPSIGVIGNVGTTASHRPYLSMYRSAGNTVNDKTLVPYNYHLGSITWQGADGIDFQPRGAEITAITDSITGVNDMPTALFFGTTANGQEQPTERMRITSAGNVGIANNTPTNLLDVGSTSIGPTSTIGIKTNTAAATTRVAFENGTSVKGDVLTTSNATVIGTGGMAIQTTTNHPIIFRTNSSGDESGGNERMRIDASGNVGIGTASPTAKLHINNPSSTTPALNIVSNSNVIGSTNDAVSINMQPGNVNQNNTGVRIFNTTTGTSAEGNNTGITVSLNARNSSYGLYSSVTKNWGGASLFGEAVGVYGRAATDSPFGFSYGGYFKNDSTAGTGFGVFVQTNTPLGSGTVTPLAIQHNSTELMRVQSSGNVGIGTASPARILHVNATSAIRIPVGTTTDRGTSANGDIRYNTTNANFEWYSGTGWREPVNAARSPAAGLANRFSKFDANGLLDTSAILIQANNRIGIFNSPAAGDSALTVTGGIRATTGVRATRLNVNTFSTQVVSINNFAPVGSLGENLWIGNGGQQSQFTSGSTGAQNTAIGTGALLQNTTGYGNMAIGRDAMQFNKTGAVNIALGASALQGNISGFYNVAIGALAMQNSNSGANMALGYGALNGYTQTGDEAGANTCIGFATLFSKTTGSGDVAIGWMAGRYIAATYGNPVTSSANSVYIGTAAYPGANSVTNTIVIGSGAVGNGSNTTTIGNSRTTKTFFQYGKTYIGTATDNGAYNLQVAGGSYLSGEIKYVNRPAAAAVTNVGVDANGVLREATSSQRFKDNITPYQKGLSDAMRLQAKTYTYKGDTTLQAGFIAEDVHEAGLTEYVNYDKEGKPYSLQYGNMVTLLLNAMKEQQAQIEALKKEIEALKNK